MAIVPMTDAASGGIALSAEYNKLIDNIQDLDARLGAVVSGNPAHTRLTSLETLTGGGTSGNAALDTRVGSLESLTTNTATNGGHGNVRLSDRLGTGVGTGSNVTTGSATSQLTNIRSRLTTIEGSGLTPGPWTAITSWVTQSGTAWGNRSGFPTFSVRLLPGDNVQVYGTVFRSPGGGAAGQAICTIPVGFRPQGPAVVFGMDSQNNLCAMEILADGTMQIKVPTTRYTDTTSTTWISANTISISHQYYIGTGVPNA